LLPPLSSLGSPRIIGSSVLHRLTPAFTKISLASLTLYRHLSVSTSNSSSLYLKPGDPPGLFQKTPRLSSPALQHFRIKKPFFFTPPSPGKRPQGLPSPMEGSYPGFGYPLYELAVFSPSEASFSSQRSWASPFKALLLLSDRLNRSQSNLPFWRSPTKPPGLVPALQRVPPT